MHSYLRLPANCQHVCHSNWSAGGRARMQCAMRMFTLRHRIQTWPDYYVRTRLWLGMKQTEEVSHRNIGNTTKSVCV